MSSSKRLRSARVIQQFYRKYVKVQRDPVTHYPLDPISRDGIMPERRIRMHLMEGGGGIQYFDVETLNQWFKTCLQPLNPLTNTNFTVAQLGCILRAYEKVQKKPPMFIVAAFAPPPPPPPPPSPPLLLHSKAKKKTAAKKMASASASASAAAAEEEEEVIMLERRIIMAVVLEENVEWVRHVLFSNASGIQEGYVNLNYKIQLTHTEPPPVVSASFLIKWPLGLMVTPLMCAVYYDNIAVVKELLYFNLDINAEHLNVKAADMALLSTQPNSCEILQWLLYYGAKLGTWHDFEIVMDTQKLELLFQCGFMV
jgi:hypothetical protein